MSVPDILERILAVKREEVAQAKAKPLAVIEAEARAQPPAVGFCRGDSGARGGRAAGGDR